VEIDRDRAVGLARPADRGEHEVLQVVAPDAVGAVGAVAAVALATVLARDRGRVRRAFFTIVDVRVFLADRADELGAREPLRDRRGA
jgi:hypothetical protein